MTPRIAVYDALWTRLLAVAPFVTTGRRLPPWYDVAPPEAMPALFLAVARETTARLGRGARLAWRADFELYVYAATPPPVEPMTVLGPLLDAIEAALAPSPGQDAQTLGGACSSCVLGSVDYYEGTLGDVAIAIAPVAVVVSP
jgi:hypothetical protein